MSTPRRANIAAAASCALMACLAVGGCRASRPSSRAAAGPASVAVQHSTRLAHLNEQLVSAVDRYKPEAVAHLLREGADPNYVDRDGDTPISWAKDVPDAQALIAAGARMDPAGSATAICSAITGHDPAFVRWLLAHGADPNGKTPSGDMPLAAAADWDDTDSALALLGAGADVNPPKPREDPVVVIAATAANPVLVVAFLRHGAHADSLATEATSGIGCTALFCAASNVDATSVAALLARGATPNLSRCGETPLTAALRSRYGDPPPDWDHRSRGRFEYDKRKVIAMLRSFGATSVPVTVPRPPRAGRSSATP